MEQTIDFKDRFSMLKFVATADIFTNGQNVKQFESDWNDWLGSKYSLFVSSGSTANFLLIASVKEKYGLKDGDKVLLPACTWMTNVAPVIQLGLEPVFCDINLSDFSFNKSHMQDIAKQHPDIKMIFVTHLLGFAADNKIYSEIFPEAIILDDVCESHGAKFSNGSKVGSDSLGATFSFYFGHHMTTIEGGMVSTNDKELYDLMKMKRSHGMARESVDFDKYADKYPDINKSFLFITDGYNFRNHEVCAVLGISQLKKLDKSINKRRENYSMFHSVIIKYPDLFYIPDHQDGNSSFCFPIICNNKEVFNKLKDKMIDHGIEFRPIVGGNLLKHPFLSEYKLAPSFDNNYVVDIVEQNGLYVGNSQFINKNHIELLDKIFMEIL